MKFNINHNNLLDIINLNFNVYSPLKEFVSKKNFLSITRKCRLVSDEFFPLPIFINISLNLYNKYKSNKIIKVYYKSKKVCNLRHVGIKKTKLIKLPPVANKDDS